MSLVLKTGSIQTSSAVSKTLIEKILSLFTRQMSPSEISVICPNRLC